MALAAGDKVSALINSNQLILSLDNTVKLSCRNKFTGLVNSVKKGAVNSEVFIKLDVPYFARQLFSPRFLLFIIIFPILS